MLRTQKENQNKVLDLLDDMVEALELVGHVDAKAVVVVQLMRVIDNLRGIMNETVEFVDAWTKPERSIIRGEYNNLSQVLHQALHFSEAYFTPSMMKTTKKLPNFEARSVPSFLGLTPPWALKPCRELVGSRIAMSIRRVLMILRSRRRDLREETS
jgi:hypothetical protein